MPRMRIWKINTVELGTVVFFFFSGALESWGGRHAGGSDGHARHDGNAPPPSACILLLDWSLTTVLQSLPWLLFPSGQSFVFLPRLWGASRTAVPSFLLPSFSFYLYSTQSSRWSSLCVLPQALCWGQWDTQVAGAAPGGGPDCSLPTMGSCGVTAKGGHGIRYPRAGEAL